MVLRSLRGLLWSLWLLLPCGFSPGKSFPSVSGFSSSCLGVPGWLPCVFFSNPVASLSSLSGSLALSGYPVYPLPRSFLSGIWRLCVSSACRAPFFSYLGFTVISLVLPLFLRVIALSFCLLALLFVLFLGLSLLFLVVSFLLLPRLPLLFLSVEASWYVCS